MVGYRRRRRTKPSLLNSSYQGSGEKKGGKKREKDSRERFELFALHCERLKAEKSVVLLVQKIKDKNQLPVKVLW